MATGFEVKMYNDISRTARALESIAASLEKIANPLVVVPEVDGQMSLEDK